MTGRDEHRKTVVFENEICLFMPVLLYALCPVVGRHHGVAGALQHRSQEVLNLLVVINHKIVVMFSTPMMDYPREGLERPALSAL